MRAFLSPGKGKPGARRPVGPKWGAILPFQRLVGNFWRHFCHVEWRVPLVKAAVEHQQCMGQTPNNKQSAGHRCQSCLT